MSALPHEPQRQGRSSVWALILIAVGVIWLLLQAGILSGANLAVLLRLWPIVLIAIGLELLIGRRSQALSLLIGGGAVVVLFVLMLVGPSLGLVQTANVQTAQYSEPLDDASSAQINVDFAVGSVTIQALSDSNALIDADVRYVGEVDFDSSTANGEKTVTLTAREETGHIFDFLTMFSPLTEDDLHWQIGLSPSIPLDLRLNGGVGETTLDLSGVQLASLRYDGGVGSSTINLPAGRYDFDLQGGIGGTTIRFMDDAAVDANLVGGVGGVTLDLPDDAPVRLEVTGTLGNIDLPENFNALESNKDVDESGIWESDSYPSAEDGTRIRIHFDGGVGGLNIE